MRIWEPSSQFVTVIDQLIALYNNMPERYYLTDANLYVLKDKGMLGAVFALHLFIHAVIFDLTRISLAGFSFPLAPAFKNSPVEFRAHCQSLCRFHASQVSDIIRTGLSFNRGAFDDLFCPDAAIESTKVQIIFAATVDQSPQTLQVTRDNIISNLNFLLTIHNRGKEAPTQFVSFDRPIDLFTVRVANSKPDSWHYSTMPSLWISRHCRAISGNTWVRY